MGLSHGRALKLSIEISNTHILPKKVESIVVPTKIWDGLAMSDVEIQDRSYKSPKNLV